MAAKPKPARRGAASKAAGKIEVRNVNVPGYTHRVDAAMYTSMRKALLQALPSKAPGLTQNQMYEAVLAHVPAGLFPKGEKVGWWMKTVQLDLEARGLVKREDAKPLRWHRTP